MQNRTQDVHLPNGADPTLHWIGAIGLTVAVGIVYFFAAELSLALLAKSGGLTMFWLAGGMSSGVLIALGHHARLPVAGGTIVATIIAGLMAGRNIWVSTVLALCNAGQALLAAWLIERYFGSGFSFDRLRNVLGLLAAAIVASAAGAVGGTMAYKLLQGPTTPLWITSQHWFASGSIGIITVAPLMIGLAEALRVPPRRNEIVEGVIALAALTVTQAFQAVCCAAGRRLAQSKDYPGCKGTNSTLHAPAKPLPIIVSGTMILSYSSARILPEAMAASLSVVPSAAAFSAMCAAF
jgi:hypothetical protein